PEVKQLLEQRLLEMGHARALLSLTQAELQFKLAQKVVQRQLSVRETERLVKNLLEGTPPRKESVISVDVQRLEQQLAEQLGAKVEIRYNKRGRGKMVIEYNNLDELDGILSHIRPTGEE
ncbi:MAG TPA: chromosome partitioning protein ParB, partial [Thiolinea sp.]|nr:chromosome partitioning protein ParB [Thiolinea sp.]